MPGPFELLFLYTLVTIAVGLPCAFIAFLLARRKGRPATSWAIRALLLNVVAVLLLVLLPKLEQQPGGAFPVGPAE